MSKRQLAMVMDLNKCLGCHTCSVACKTLWTKSEGMEYMWWNTVNTMPHETVLAFADHGIAKGDTVTAGIEQASKLESELVALGIDVPAVIHALQVEGVKKFADSFAALNNTIAKKLQS